MSGKSETGIKVLRPVPSKFRISSPFGDRIHPVTKEKSFHKGVDFSCPEGTEARACFDGVVALLKTKEDGNGAGNRLSIYGKAHRALYFHLKDDGFMCNLGKRVKKGEIVALTGKTGRVTGPHLHFEIRIINSDKPIQPEFEGTKNDTAVA